MPAQLETAQHIWGELIEPNRFGLPVYKNGLEPTPGDPREIPVNYMLMCGVFEEYPKSSLNTDRLRPGNVPSEYTLDSGEDTSVSGLLRVVDKIHFPIREPKEAFVVGSMTESGLTGTMMWLQSRGWTHTSITVVDKEKLPLATMRALMNRGVIDWPAGISLVHSDIRNIQGKSQNTVVIADILNPYMDSWWAESHFDQKSPYEPYERFLRDVKSSFIDSWFLSRCFIPPNTRHHFPKYPRPKNKATVDDLETAWQQLEPMQTRLSKDDTLASAGTFNGDNRPPIYCGLYTVGKIWQAKSIIRGPHAEKVYKRLHRRVFEELYQATVRDSDGNSFLTFACKI